MGVDFPSKLTSRSVCLLDAIIEDLEAVYCSNCFVDTKVAYAVARFCIKGVIA